MDASLVDRLGSGILGLECYLGDRAWLPYGTLGSRSLWRCSLSRRSWNVIGGFAGDSSDGVGTAEAVRQFLSGGESGVNSVFDALLPLCDGSREERRAKRDWTVARSVQWKAVRPGQPSHRARTDAGLESGDLFLELVDPLLE